MTIASPSSKVKPVRVLGQTSAYVVLAIGLVATLLPFVYVFLSTLKPDGEQLRVPPTFFPQNWTLEHYIHILTDKSLPLHRFLSNSLLVSIARVCITLAALPVNVVDSTGAGDTFDAGFLFGWLNGWEVEQSLRLGCICGSLSTKAVGGVNGQPTLAEATEILKTAR